MEAPRKEVDMKLFITGVSGYIGKASVAALLRHGHVVEAVAAPTRQRRLRARQTRPR
jgi:nucleoside-diphosphate-sugar epimerase